jgi:hypothetical protein
MEDIMIKQCVIFKPFLALRHRAFYSTPLIILCLIIAAPGCNKSQDESITGKEGKSTQKTRGDATKEKVKEKLQLPTAVQGEEATLTLTDISKNTFGIELNNSAPVRLVQFTVNGIKDAQVRSTARTDGFLIKFTKDNTKVTILSPSGNTIAPGSGFIVEMSCDAPTATLSDIKIAK